VRQGFSIADDAITQLLKGLSVLVQWRFGLIEEHPTMTVIGVGQILVMGGKGRGSALFTCFILLGVTSSAKFRLNIESA